MADIAKQTIYKQNDQILKFTLKNGDTGAFINAGTVTATIKDEADSIVGGFNTVAAVPTGSNGVWKVPITDSFDPAENTYFCYVTGNDGAGNDINVRFKVAVKVRKG